MTADPEHLLVEARTGDTATLGRLLEQDYGPNRNTSSRCSGCTRPDCR